MVCEQCWSDARMRAHTSGRPQYECYLELLEERKDNPCPEPIAEIERLRQRVAELESERDLFKWDAENAYDKAWGDLRDQLAEARQRVAELERECDSLAATNLELASGRAKAQAERDEARKDAEFARKRYNRERIDNFEARKAPERIASWLRSQRPAGAEWVGIPPGKWADDIDRGDWRKD